MGLLILTKGHRDGPTLILANLQQGLRHHQAGRLELAEKHYRRVLQIDPRQADALHLLGMAAFARGDAERARELVCQAIQAKPEEAVFYANLGIVYESLLRWPEAEAAYCRAVDLNPRNATALNSLGNLHRAAWRLDRAARYYQQAVEIDHRFVAAQSNLGNTFADLGHFDQAIACYRRAINIDPSFIDAHKNLATSLTQQGRYDEAAKQLGRAQALRPDDAALQIRSALHLPTIIPSSAWIDQHRRALSDELDSLLKTELRVDDPIDQTLGPAFYLPYHGRNDVDLQRKLAAVYARAIPSLTFVAPHCRVAGARTRSPIRVGLISRFFHQHVIGDHYAGLLRSFPRNQASYTVFQFPEANDTSRAESKGRPTKRLSFRYVSPRRVSKSPHANWTFLFTPISAWNR